MSIVPSLPESYVKPRNGLAQSYRELFSAPRRIGYLGASITAQKAGYRPLLHQWFCDHTGHAHQQANAGLGATGSICSVFVMDQLILKHRPALCFVEASVGDMAPYTPLTEVGPVLEGIFRKLLEQECAICLLHLYRGDRSHQNNPVIQLQEAVAEHYGVPSLHIGRFIEDIFANRDTERERLFKDQIHTSDQGAEYLTNLISNAVCSIERPRLPQKTISDSTPILHKRNYTRTKIVPCQTEMVTRTNATLGLYRFFYRYILVPAGGRIEFTCTEEVVGILVIVGPHSGIIEVHHGTCAQRMQLFDQWCTADRLSTAIFDHFAAPHTSIRIEVPRTCSEDMTPLREGPDPQLQIIGFLVRQESASADGYIPTHPEDSRLSISDPRS